MTQKLFLRDLTSTVGSHLNVGIYFKKDQNGLNQPGYPGNSQPLHRGKRKSRRRFQGALDEHPYFCHVLSYLNPIMHLERDVPGYGGDYTMFGLGLPSFYREVGFDANDDLELLGRLKEQIAGQGFNLAVTLGESKELLETIGNGALRIAGALRALKKGNLKAVAKQLGVKEGRTNTRNHGSTLTSTWLEYRYGWEPILTDIHSAAELLAYQLSGPQSLHYFARKAKTVNVAGPPHGLWKYDFAVGSVRKQIVAILTEKPSLANLLGFTNPALVAWELVPLSFVADWFLPIGDYLEQRGFFGGLTGTFVTTTTSRDYSRGYSSGDPLTEFRYIITGGGAATYRSTITERVVSTSLTVPTPAVVPFNKALSWKRAVSALSLINILDLRF